MFLDALRLIFRLRAIDIDIVMPISSSVFTITMNEPSHAKYEVPKETWSVKMSINRGWSCDYLPTLTTAPLHSNPPAQASSTSELKALRFVFITSHEDFHSHCSRLWRSSCSRCSPVRGSQSRTQRRTSGLHRLVHLDWNAQWIGRMRWNSTTMHIANDLDRP